MDLTIILASITEKNILLTLTLTILAINVELELRWNAI